MFYLTIVKLFLLNIYSIYSPNFITRCFTIYGHPKKTINILFNDQLTFIPDELEFITTLREHNLQSSSRNYIKNQYTLRRQDQPCEQNFMYVVPETQYPFMTLTLQIAWGPFLHNLDSLKLVMEPDFTESLHFLEGVNEYIFMNVLLKHQRDTNLSNTARPDFYDILLHKRVRALLSGESYCMRFWGTVRKNILIFSKNPRTTGPLSEYFIMTQTISAVGGAGIFIAAENLVQIFPCVMTDDLNDNLPFIIEPTTKRVLFSLYDYIDRNSFHITDYSMSGGSLTSNALMRDFEFANFKLTMQSLEEYDAKGRPGVLLARYQTITTICKFRMNENVNGLGLSYVYEIRANYLLIDLTFRRVDLATKHLKVYKIRKGRLNELFSCFVGENTI